MDGGEVGGLVMSLAFSLGAFFGGGWWCLKRFYEGRLLLDTPTSKIRSAAQGYVELYGVLREPQHGLLQGPLTGRPCVWWRFRIEEYSESGKDKRWRVVESGVSDQWLALGDGTGECLIDPRGAEVRPATREVWRGNQRHPLRVESGGFFGSLFGGGDYRYTEERLELGRPLYAIGEFVTTGAGQQGFDAGQAERVVIREWKSDFAGLLKRFDNNGDGRLDEAEWGRVRLAAQLEAEDRHRATSAAPAVHRMRCPGEARPFLLSSHGEDVLARAFFWQALGAGLACIVGAVATVYLLRTTGWL